MEVPLSVTVEPELRPYKITGVLLTIVAKQEVKSVLPTSKAGKNSLLEIFI
jgi:hypothetical protein